MNYSHLDSRVHREAPASGTAKQKRQLTTVVDRAGQRHLILHRAGTPLRRGFRLLAQISAVCFARLTSRHPARKHRRNDSCERPFALLRSLLLGMALLAASGSASGAVVTFTETFNTNASNWLNGASAAPTYNATGGIGDSGFISYTSTFTSGATGSFPGADPLQLLFRGNNAADASGDAFVGNWLSDGVLSLSVAVRHNYTTALDLYVRLDAGSGRAASLAPSYTIEPNVWTTFTIPITDSNPPFLSYGAGIYSNVFNSIQNVQFGLYVPASTTFTNLRMDLDNVTVNTVPEPSAAISLLGGVGLLLLHRRRRVNHRSGSDFTGLPTHHSARSF